MAILNFVEFTADNFAQDMPRRQCFDVNIIDDDISENTESFRVLLAIDPFKIQEVFKTSPAMTEIFILDTGNY